MIHRRDARINDNPMNHGETLSVFIVRRNKYRDAEQRKKKAIFIQVGKLMMAGARDQSAESTRHDIE